MNNGARIELAEIGGMIGVRDSKNPTTPPLLYTRAEIIAFFDGVKKGEFDHFASGRPDRSTSV